MPESESCNRLMRPSLVICSRSCTREVLAAAVLSRTWALHAKSPQHKYETDERVAFKKVIRAASMPRRQVLQKSHTTGARLPTASAASGASVKDTTLRACSPIMSTPAPLDLVKTATKSRSGQFDIRSGLNRSSSLKRGRTCASARSSSNSKRSNAFIIVSIAHKKNCTFG